MNFNKFKTNHFTYFLFLCLISQFSLAQESWNVNLLGEINRGDSRYSGCWSYVDDDGKEYALIGAKTGLAAYCIDNDTFPELGFIPGPVTNWREVTVVGNHAFVVTDVQDSLHKLQVIDLSYLPDSLHLLTTYDSTFTKGHIIQSDLFNDTPYIYVNGTSTTQGVHILDVSNPENPVEVGLYEPGYYIHDCHVRGDILFACAFHITEIDIVDISDKSNPTLIGKIIYEGDNTHSCFTSDDGKYLFVADEKDAQPGRVFHIEDLDDPFQVAEYTANDTSLVHNPYIRGDFVFISHNTEGLRVVDFRDPVLPVEVGFYDTFLGESGGFKGLWSACPFYPSGKIIGGDRTRGLFIWEFEETFAGRFYGDVYDIETGENILFADINLLNLDTIIQTNLSGNFKYGTMPGEYGMTISKTDYTPYLIDFQLFEKDSLYFKIPLISNNSENGYIFGVVKDSITGEPISEAILEIPELSLQLSSDETGYFDGVISSGNFELIATSNGYISKNIDLEIIQSNGQQFEILLNKIVANTNSEQETSDLIKIYPNPSNEFLTIDLTNFPKANSIKLHDSNGKMILEKTIHGGQVTEIDLRNFGKGVYFVSTYFDKKLITTSNKIILK